MAWRKNDPSLGNDPTYLEPRITSAEHKISAVEKELPNKVDNSEKGVANGIATLNADGKVVDAEGNEVDGKVKTVNGVGPNETGNIEVPTFSGDYNDLVNRPDLSLISKTLLKGSSTFNSTTGRVIPHSIGHTNYIVRTTPTQNPNGYLGEVWVEKSATSFKVCCSGTATTNFDYVVVM